MEIAVIMPVYDPNNDRHWERGIKSIQEQKDIGAKATFIAVCDAPNEVRSKFLARAITLFWNEQSKNEDIELVCLNFQSGKRDGLTRNKGLDYVEKRLPQADWIMFMDDDDWWLHEYVLSQLVKCINIHHNDYLGAIAFGFIWKDVGYVAPVRNDGSFWPAVWSKIWNRDAITGCRFSDKWSESDMDFNAAVMEKWNHKNRFLFWDMPIYYYNFLRKGSISEIDGFKKESIRF